MPDRRRNGSGASRPIIVKTASFGIVSSPPPSRVNTASSLRISFTVGSEREPQIPLPSDRFYVFGLGA